MIRKFNKGAIVILIDPYTGMKVSDELVITSYKLVGNPPHYTYYVKNPRIKNNTRRWTVDEIELMAVFDEQTFTKYINEEEQNG